MCFLFFACQNRNGDPLSAPTGSTLQGDGQQVDTSQQLVVPAWFTAASARQLGQELDSIFEQLHRKKGFNGTVLVTKWDQVVYRGAFGYADLKKKDTLSTETVFQLASVSKQFTAMAIMMLKEEGRLDYDDSLHHHLPTLPYRGITIRQLLTHRSGLSNYTYFSDKLWPDRSQYMTNEDVLRLMAAHKPDPYFQPDVRFDYSNTGYALLASVVEQVAGMPFARYLQTRIFTPLKMHNTFTFSPEELEKRSNVATGYTGGRRLRTPDYLDGVLGDKGVYSTVEDLYKWDQALYTQKLVKQQTLEEAFTGTRRKRKRDEDYGFGWRIRELERGDTVVYHAGLWHGYATYMLRNPKEHSALIVLSNVPNGSLRFVKELQEYLHPARPEARPAGSIATASPSPASRSEQEEEQLEGGDPAP
ncbi:serine hydrolase domain-containing protein [Cesiribacter andamanensis]|uniref:serine hydrolase domain-containing protein n=1 Tax=Cesiribacter andamanensis TaxID=649507 RepID=UPI000345377F|nr:serine hydrolase domain-containing protein [Cesiribacter andamanensis]